MKPAATLKEIKPPFYSYLNNICVNDEKAKMVFLLRMWADVGDEFRDFALQALNEKWERDFGEPSNEDDEEEAGVYCYDCRKFYEDDKAVLRCKDKPGCIRVDPDVCEPCPGFEGGRKNERR